MAETAAATAEAVAPETTKPAGETTAAAESAAASTTVAAEAATQTDTDAPAGTEQPASGPPETYALEVPEGGPVSAEGLKAFEAEARLLGLTNAQAQAHLDRQLDAFQAQAEADLAATKADPVYGGAKLAETQRHAAAAYKRFAPEGTPHGDALRALLRDSGRGNALAVVAFFASIGKAMAEDRPIGGGHGQAGGEDTVRLADRMYANTTSKREG